MMSPVRNLIIPGILIFINIGYSHQQVFQLNLKNITIAPGGFGSFDAQLSDGDTGTGTWSKDGNSLSVVPGKLVTTQTGLYRQLFLFNAVSSDAGRYTFTINGQSTSAYLTVGASGPVDGNWGGWSQWNGPSCPATCGPTARRNVTRLRSCNNPAPSNGGSECSGNERQTENRECGPTSCAVAVNGNWGEWSQWSGTSCPASCGATATRQVTRSRNCNNPAPSNGGASCPGGNSESRSDRCGPLTCVTSIFTSTLSDQRQPVRGQVQFQVNLAQPGITGVWRKDGVNITADGTHQIVSNNNVAILFISSLQVSDSGRYSFTANGETTSAQLTVDSSPVNGNWGEWSQWSSSSCPATCGPAATRQVTRSRSCNNPAPSNGGSSCLGQSTQTESRLCGPSTCVSGPVNGNWGEWSQWSGSSCPATCGAAATRQVTRSRSCNNPAPSNGGIFCQGQSTQTESRLCGPTTCGTIVFGLSNFTVQVGHPVVLQVTVSQPGLTGTWQRDGAIINGGTGYTISSPGSNHILFISDPQVSDSGRYTFTVRGDVTSAWLTVSGPINGNWGEWSQWSAPSCPASCGATATRQVTRSRNCNNPAPSNGGDSCPDSNSESRSDRCGPLTCGASVIVTQIQNITRGVGNQIVFQVQLTQPSLVGSWQKDDGAIPTDSRIQFQNTGTIYLYISSLQMSDSGKYTFTVEGETTTAFVTVTSDTAVNGNWGEWSQWSGSSCPATCGPTATRQVTRSRSCNNPAPSNGGDSCLGQNSQTESRECGPSTCDTAVNGNWGEWSQWSGSACAATCGPTATRQVIRSRSCNNPAPSNGGDSCLGQSSQTESRLCGPSTCVPGPVNGNWGEWSQWSGISCPATCGPTATRQVTRSRSCNNPAPSNGGASCPGQSNQTESRLCGPTTCVGGGVSEWGSWNNPTCPATCGRAVYHTQKRYRTCNTGNTCTEILEESKRVICMDSFCPVDGGFSQWSMWTITKPCREICGPGFTKTLVRTRSCTNPTPSFGGRGCTGDTQQTSVENCTLPVCGAIQSQLQSQSAAAGGMVVFQAVLSQDNAVGYWQRNGITLTNSAKTRIESIGKTQKLTISNVQASDVGNYSFVVNGETTTAALTLQSSTPVDGGFSEWGVWTSGQCSVTCGDGLTTDTRSRTCTNPVPQNGGRHCSGPTTETRTSPCTRACIVNGGYTQWSGWVGGSCSGSCDQGIQTDTRTRSCTNPRPQNGGRVCAAPSSETRTKSCVLAECAVHGGVTDWGAWVNQTCTASCGKGTTRTVDRHRNCTNPEPRYGGRPCVQHLYESKVVNCGLKDCESAGTSSFTLEKDGLYIGLIAAIIAIGVFLIIIIVACCLWNCRKNAKSHQYQDKMNSFDLDSISRPNGDYVTRGKYMDPAFNGSMQTDMM